MGTPIPLKPRLICSRCRRPERVCYCSHLPSLQTKTRVVLLQHPRERDKAIGTGRMASLALPNSELHVGVCWEGSALLERILANRAQPVALLYPGPGAIDLVTHPPSGPITLIVVDGTWSQTKNLVRDNPTIAALPRYAFTPATPSEYRIRREPRETYVSTIEALSLVLGVLEEDATRFRAMLKPFRAMVDAQIAITEKHPCARGRHKKLQPLAYHPVLPVRFAPAYDRATGN